jgi:hypothetical protein
MYKVNAAHIAATEGKHCVSEMAVGGGVKCNGRDAWTLVVNGGCEVLIQHLNMFLVNAHLENKEAVDKLLERIENNSDLFSTETAEFKLFWKKMRQMQTLEIGDLDEEAFGSFITHLFEAFSDNNTKYDCYMKEAVELGTDVIRLYNNDTKSHPRAQKALEVFKALKACVLPIVDKKHEHALEHLDSHLSELLKLIKGSEFESMGKHSYYIHWLLVHSKDDCLRVKHKWNMHLSDFSCQTSEHWNKVLKRLVERLHGFTNRSVSMDAWRNKFGFIMHECMLRVLHFFHTLKPKRYQACSKCGIVGHNRRTCV